MLVDSHCHLHDREFFTTEQAEKMLVRAHEKDVQKIICIGTSHEDSLVARDFAASRDGVYWTYGIHPESATNENPELTTIQNTLNHHSPVAIGEVGLDYHYNGYNREAQIRLFEKMLQLAIDNDLPLSFHVREAFPDFLAVTANFPTARGVVHSFTDSKKTLRKILENTDFYVGMNGLATYSTLPIPPLDRILLETDAPFLTPEPFRGIINEPGYILEIAKWLSDKIGVELEEIKRKTTKNAEELFRLSN